jgi:ribonucleoside-diphosphate reductase alpha chain
VFRELAVSYMGRFDLAHVDPSESNFDAMGKGVEEGKMPEQPEHVATKYVSKGLTRSRTDRLVVVARGTEAAPAANAVAVGAVESESSPVKLGFSRLDTKMSARAEAKAKGYVGESCTECGNFTLVRNGTCLKCETCGSTTGCS